MVGTDFVDNVDLNLHVVFCKVVVFAGNNDGLGLVYVIVRLDVAMVVKRNSIANVFAVVVFLIPNVMDF